MPGDAELSNNQPPIIIPQSTIRDLAKKKQEEQDNKQIILSAASTRLNSGRNELMRTSADKKSRSITTIKMRELLANTAKACDEAQNGMSRKEMIQIMVQLTGKNAKTCENHFDWLIREKKLTQLKNCGRVQKAQPTTTKRACIRIEQQLRWHNTIEIAWEDHCKCNQPTDEFLRLQPHFLLNLDETCVMGNLSNLRIVGSAEVKKHEK